MVAVLLIPLGYKLRAVEVTVSEVQTREWTQKVSPDGKGPKILNHDKFVDYKRDGKIIFRKIVRKQTALFPGHEEPGELAQHIIEFVANDKVFALMTFDESAIISWAITSEGPVQFSGFSGSPSHRFFHVCFPKADYYEYLQMDGTEIKQPLLGGDNYKSVKRAMIESTEVGFINPLGRESGLEQEKK